MSQTSQFVNEFFARNTMRPFNEFIHCFVSIIDLPQLLALTKDDIADLGVLDEAAIPLYCAIRRSETVKEFFKRNDLDQHSGLLEDLRYVDNAVALFDLNKQDFIGMGIRRKDAKYLYEDIKELNPNKKKEKSATRNGDINYVGLGNMNSAGDITMGNITVSMFG